MATRHQAKEFNDDQDLQRLVDLPFRVVCGIELQNRTRFLLTDPAVTIEGGQVKTPPSEVSPFDRTVMVARKKAFAIGGTYGTVSWKVEDLDRRVVLMWSAPYSFSFHENCLAVAITKTGYVDHEDTWFEKMHKGITTTNFNGMDLKKFKNAISSVRIADDDLIVTGTMGTTHKAPVRINVRSKSDTELKTTIF